jgi:tetratricopeptide (TPR) repeat protein
MKEFDCNKPENYHIKSFYEEKKCLIISPLQMVRILARKLATNVGVRAQNIDMVNNFYEAQKLLKEREHEIVISEYYLGDRVSVDMEVDENNEVNIFQFDGRNKYGLDLLDIHKEIHPNRLSSIFVVISDYKSQNVAYKCFEAEAELFLTKPLAYEHLEKGFLKITDQKLYADETMKEVANVKQYVYQGDLGMAHQVLDLIRERNISNTELFYTEGLIYSKEGKWEPAINALKEAISMDENHYKSYCALFDTYFSAGMYKDAYETGKILTQKFPINPSRLPNLVKVSLANKEYEDVNNFVQIFMELDDKDPDVSKQLSAGLIVSGKILGQAGHIERAVFNLKKAAEFCEGEKKVLVNALENMIAFKATKEAKALMLKIQEDNAWDQDYDILELKYLLAEEDFGDALTKGLKLVNKGIKEPEIFVTCLEASISIGRRKDAVEEILENAIKACPEHEEHFQEVLKKAV